LMLDASIFPKEFLKNNLNPFHKESCLQY